MSTWGTGIKQSDEFADVYDENIDNDMNDIYEFDKEWRTQEVVTDKEFEEVMKRYEKKKKYKKYEFEPDEKKDMMNDMSILTALSTGSKTILIPATFRTYEGEIIPAGYYLAKYSKEGNDHILTISQGRKIYAKIVLEKSSEKVDSEEILVIKIQHIDNDTAKIIYSDVDLNLEKTLYIVR